MSTGCREQVIELLKKYSLGSPLIDERMMDWLRLFYTYARVDLQAENAELKAENERLRMALADTEALEIGTAERCAKLTHQRDEYKAVLENLLEVVDEPPERNCSCHIAPPCNDCVNWSGLREALSDARTAAKGATE